MSASTNPPGARARVARALRNSSLSLFFAVLFVGALVAQAFSGVAVLSRDLVADGLEPVSLLRYVTSSSFAVDVSENWQSEFLQFLLYILATVWLLQRGSPESKELDQAGRESDEDQKVGRFATVDSPRWAHGGWRLRVYQHSLGLTMGAIFLASWAVQAVTGAVAYSQEQLLDHADPVTLGEYLTLPDFWNRTTQNWQSEFLAVLSMVVLSIYLRERGSPESKPVGEPHDSTGIEG